MATSILQGLGNFGSDIGKGAGIVSDENRQNARAQLEQLQAKMQLAEFQQRLKEFQARQQEEQQKQPGPLRKAIEAAMGRPLTDTEAARLFQVQDPNPKESIQEIVGPDGKSHRYMVNETTGEKKDLGLAGTTANPPKPTEFDEWRDQFKKSHDRDPNDREIALWHRQPKAEGGIAELPERTLKALADKWNKEGIKPPAKYQAAVEQYMEEHEMKAKVKLTAKEQGLADLTKQIQPKIDQLKTIIEKSGLENENGAWDNIMQRGRMMGYKFGIKPEQTRADIIKSAAALQVMGAAPWMQLGRGKYMFETIVQHLPKPTDSPALLHDKAMFLQSIIDDARESLPQTDAPATLDDALDNIFGPKKGDK